MYYVYVIKDSEGKIYKGITNDLTKRVDGHRSGNTKNTRSMKDIKVVYFEEVATRLDARAREKYLKSSAGRRFLKTKII